MSDDTPHTWTHESIEDCLLWLREQAAVLAAFLGALSSADNEFTANIDEMSWYGYEHIAKAMKVRLDELNEVLPADVARWRPVKGPFQADGGAQ